MYIRSFLLLIGFCGTVGAFASAETLPDFRLLDTEGRSYHAHHFKDVRAVVVMAVPESDSDEYRRLVEFSRLADSIAANSVQFLVIATSNNPVWSSTRGDVPVLLDEAQVVLPALKLTHAYECVAANTKDWNVFYRGDCGQDSLGKALAAQMGNQPIPSSAPTTGAELALNPATGNVSYAKDVAPILASRCVSCHSEGNIGPFAMDNHRKVAGHAGMIAETILTQRMPPWQADPHYGNFSNAMTLTNDERRTLLAWIDAGAPKDGDADPLTQVKPAKPDTWRLGQPDVVIKLPEPQQIPAEGVLEYKYYDLPLALPEGTWLRGTEVRITAPEVMHHVLVYMHQPGEDFDFTQEYIASYVPGHDPGFFPEGTGKPVPKNAMLLFQLHYTTNGKAVTDTPELGLYLSKTPPAHEIFLGSGVERHFTVPPNAADTEAEATFRADSDMLVYSLSPHLHYRGSRMSFEACYPDGKREMLLSVPNYDFYWQHSYHLAEPKLIPKGTAIRVVGGWDNSVRNPLNPDPSATLHWGDQSTDEMFIGSILYRRAD